MANLTLERMMRSQAKENPVVMKEDKTALPDEVVQDVPQEVIDGNIPDKISEEDNVSETSSEGAQSDSDGVSESQNEQTGYQPHKLPDSIARIVDSGDESDTEVSVEMTPAGPERSRSSVDKAAARVEIPKTRPQSSKSRETVYLRDMPQALVTEARRMFPGAKSQTDAVAAFMAYKMGIVEDLTDKQFKLVRGYQEDDPVELLSQKVSNMAHDLQIAVAALQEMEFAIGFLIYDRLGFRRDSADNPLGVNMTEDGVYDMVKRMQESSRIFRARKSVKDGRPKR